jgi:hypothetical protein
MVDFWHNRTPKRNYKNATDSTDFTDAKNLAPIPKLRVEDRKGDADGRGGTLAQIPGQRAKTDEELRMLVLCASAEASAGSALLEDFSGIAFTSALAQRTSSASASRFTASSDPHRFLPA